MLKLHLLGSVDLLDAGRDVTPVLRRPKSLALLAYLACARPRGFHRRDALLALFWPDLDQAHARNALRQNVHSLRHVLGAELVVGRGEEELSVERSRVWCDVPEFEELLDASNAEAAVALYRGELLRGFHMSGSGDFEQWLDQERKHLAQRALAATLDLSKEAERTGDRVVAASWAKRAIEIAPYDESALRRLLRLLDHAGRRADAVRDYEDFADRLALDLDVAPSPETRALIETIRARVEPQVFVSAGDLLPRPSPVAAEAPRQASPRARRRLATVLTISVACLLTAGSLLFRAQAGARLREAARQKRLVVLPFTNLGPAEDAYFADGITEEVTARLAAIGRLRVVAGTSGNLYRGTKKTAQEIGRELGADYVLEGSVRWEKAPGGRARVRITPQLVSTLDDTHLWAEVYDEPLDEIFKVQSDVARNVVGALNVTLLEPERRLVEANPTSNLKAYDYYLRGSDYMRRGPEERVTRAGLRMFEKAVELDSGFALAYARLSQMHARMYWFYYDRSVERIQRTKTAVDKAFALDPTLPEAHLALGAYYFLVRLEYDRALRELDTAAAMRPNDSDIFLTRAAVRNRQGNLVEGLANYRKAMELDPGSTIIANNYAQTYDRLRSFPQAEAIYDRTITLSPDWAFSYFCKAGMYLRWQGSTAKARAVLEEARAVGVEDQPQLVLARVLVEIFDRRYEQALGLISSKAPAVISDQFRIIPRAQLYAQVYGLMQRHDLERAYSDSARAFLVSKLRRQPDDPRLHSALGIAYAGMRRTHDAILEGRKAVGLLPIGRESYRGYSLEWDLAQIYTMVGEYDDAIAQLEHLLSIPGHLTVPWLRIDPTWDHLRADARFQKLLSED